MFGWFKKSAPKEKPPAIAIEDPMLGRLELENPEDPDESFWVAKANFEGREIEISIFGSPEKPDMRGREIAIRAIAELPTHKANALHFLIGGLTEKQLARSRSNFSVTGICAGSEWQNEKSCFTLQLELEGDKNGLWRVEIGPAGPLWTGRDD